MKKVTTVIMALTMLMLFALMSSCSETVLPTENNQISISPRESLARGANCYTTLPSGLVSWWKADADATDAQGSNDGSPSGVTFLPGYLNDAFSFDGSNKYVQVTSSSPSLDFHYGDFSLSAWFKGPEQLSWQGTLLSKLSKPAGTPKREYGYSLMLRGPGVGVPQPSWGKVGFWMGDGIGDVSVFTLYSNCRYDDNDWHHVVATADRDGMAKLYVDGILVNQADISLYAGVDQVSGTPFEIGRETTYSSYPFKGLIDEVAVFDRALSEVEVIGIYEACETIGPYEHCLDPVEIDVIIDIKPGSDPNSINCQDNDDNGVIPVAILTTDVFDALTVDHTTVRFGLGGAQEIHDFKKTDEAKRHEEDVDGDGDVDLVFHFRANDTGIQCGDTEVGLTGETYGGEIIIGSDFIVTVP